MTRLKLSELEAARAAMTPTRYTVTPGYNNTGCPTAFLAIPGHNDGGKVEMLAGDATGIAATHHAAEALIRIAKAAVAWRSADDRYRKHESAIMRSDFDLATDFHQREAELDNIRMDAEQALIDALEGVEL